MFTSKPSLHREHKCATCTVLPSMMRDKAGTGQCLPCYIQYLHKLGGIKDPAHAHTLYRLPGLPHMAPCGSCGADMAAVSHTCGFCDFYECKTCAQKLDDANASQNRTMLELPFFCPGRAGW
jgi:hypothetical protein